MNMVVLDLVARALSKPYSQINHKAFTDGASLCDYYTCEIYPENRSKFREVIWKPTLISLQNMDML